MRTFAFAALAAVTLGFVNGARAATESVTYRYPVYNTSGTPKSGIKSWSTGTATATVVSGSSSAVTWKAGWYVVNDNVTITGGATCNGAVHLIVKPNCTLKVNGVTNEAGITVTGSNSLTIYETTSGGGTVTATGVYRCAGIGGGEAQSGQNITINGCTVTAHADIGAGIGGGMDGNGSGITINGGTVEAVSSGSGAGIGGGVRGGGSNITINGGTVTAESSNGGAGIGGGYANAGSNITINGGSVAASSYYGAGIGGGHHSNGSNITINGGTVTAKSVHGAGIGGGENGSGSNITINGGEVTANGGIDSAGIGSGHNGSAASNIKVPNYNRMVVKAGAASASDVIANTGGDLATALAGVEHRFVGVKPGGSITAAVTVGGTITVSATAAWAGETVTVTAKPDTGNSLASITVDKQMTIGTVPVSGGGNVRTFTMPDEAVKVFVDFAREILVASEPTALDLRTGEVRDAKPVETLTFTTNYPGGASVDITVNGETLASGLTGSGTIKWTPSVPGTSELAHIVKSGTTEITKLVAKFYVDAVVAVQPQAVEHAKKVEVLWDGVVAGEAPCSVVSNALVTVCYTAEDGYYFPDGSTTFETQEFKADKNPTTVPPELLPKAPEPAMAEVTPQDVANATAKVYTNGVEVAGPPFNVYSNATVTVIYTAADGYAFPDGRTFETKPFKADKNPTTVPEDLLPKEPTEAYAYLEPVYVGGVVTNGIDHWVTNAIAKTSCTEVASSMTTWGAAGETNWYVVAENVTIDASVACLGDVRLIVKPNCKLTVNGVGNAGIIVTGNNSLTIYETTSGGGTVNATGVDSAAGIGGGYKCAGSNITINGGTVTATGRNYGAGIGGGYYRAGSNITINGGEVTANGGWCGAGIGGGGNGGSGSYITINGGTVTATGGGYGGAGIGGGGQNSPYTTCTGSDITINGGTVTATGTDYGAGIGGGNKCAGFNITISGGTVTANGGNWGGTGIGNGAQATTAAANIYISMSLVTKADVDTDPPKTVIVNTGGDLASALNGKRYATVTPTVVVTPQDVANATSKVYTNGVEVALSGEPPSCNVLSNEVNTIIVYTANEGYEFPGGATAYTNNVDTSKNPAEIKGGEEPPKPPTPALDPVEYLAPVYKTPGDPTSGIDHWETKSVSQYTVVSDQTTWGAAGQTNWYVVAKDAEIASRITCYGDVRLILKDGAKLTALAGITASPNTSGYMGFTVYAQSEGATMGALVATGTNDAAGMGGGSSGAGSNITISGGTVTATGGGYYGAGIGGGMGGAGFNITVNGGKVTATGGSSSVSGIGNGNWGTGSACNIYISTSLITKADDSNPPTTVIENTGGDLGDKLRKKRYVMIEPPTVTVQPQPVDNTTVTVYTNGVEVAKTGEPPAYNVYSNQVETIIVYTANDGYEFPGGATTYTNNVDTSKNPTEIKGGEEPPKPPAPALDPVSYLEPVYVGGVVTNGIDHWETNKVSAYAEVTSAMTAWGAAGQTNWYVVVGDVTISSRIACLGDVRLILKDNAKLTANAGITASPGAEEAPINYLGFTVYAQSKGATMGKLVATGGNTGSGIGGLNQWEAAVGQNITINGGVITATGCGTGIGGSGNQAGAVGKDIVINGGKVAATCTALYGAGIGGGGAANGERITINGGTVKAKGDCGAGIGGGGNGAGVDITINGGTVKATGGYAGGAGVGGGDGAGGTCDGVRINGGTVTAIGGNSRASGIGKGGDSRAAAATNIFISTDLLTKADNANPPQTLIENKGGDLADKLSGNRYATVAPMTVVVETADVPNATVKVYYADGEIVKGPPFNAYTNEMVTVVYTAEDGYAFGGGESSYETEAFKADTDPTPMPMDPPKAPTLVTSGIEYLSPVYAGGIVTNGIDHWVTCKVGLYTAVTDQAAWGEAHKATWYVVEGEVTIDSRITCEGDVRLILADGATLNANAGITVSGDSNALTVYAQSEGTGVLVATSAIPDGYAGIGGEKDADGQNITINGGTVTTKGGGNKGAGIGGGEGGAASDIVINGGDVSAAGHWSSGIGGGDTGDGANIVINGGRITASNDSWGAALGGGGGGGVGKNIRINGGMVFAGATYATAIGSGSNVRTADGIYVSQTLLVKADDGNPPTTVIENTGDDLTGALRSKHYATIEPRPTVEVTPTEFDHATATVYTNGVEVAKTGEPPAYNVYSNALVTVRYEAEEGYFFPGGTNAFETEAFEASTNPTEVPEELLPKHPPQEGIDLGGGVKAVGDGEGGYTVFGEGELTNTTALAGLPITNLVIGAGITAIGDKAFYGWRSIRDVRAEKSCITIGVSAFAKCYNITNMVFSATDDITVGDYAFLRCNSLDTLAFAGSDVTFGKTPFALMSAIYMKDGMPVVYPIPQVTIAGYTQVLYGATELKGAQTEWTKITTEEQRAQYHFFQIRLEK